MKKEEFIQKISSGNCPTINGFTLFEKKTKRNKTIILVNYNSNEELEFDGIEDFYENAVLKGERVKDIIDSSEYEDLFRTTLDDSGNRIPR